MKTDAGDLHTSLFQQDVDDATPNKNPVATWPKLTLTPNFDPSTGSKGRLVMRYQQSDVNSPGWLMTVDLSTFSVKYICPKVFLPAIPFLQVNGAFDYDKQRWLHVSTSDSQGFDMENATVLDVKTCSVTSRSLGCPVETMWIKVQAIFYYSPRRQFLILTRTVNRGPYDNDLNAYWFNPDTWTCTQGFTMREDNGSRWDSLSLSQAGIISGVAIYPGNDSLLMLYAVEEAKYIQVLPSPASSRWDRIVNVNLVR
jgi:hypothetical protein